MELYIIYKNYPSHDCWGRYESDWRKTDIIFTNEDSAKLYVKNKDNLKYETIKTMD